uniref:Uncharacterized protein n=1 Tax=viral metagenome TaxID=1070528 RepID=A0A6M3J0F4_9ZZZZ
MNTLVAADGKLTANVVVELRDKVAIVDVTDYSLAAYARLAGLPTSPKRQPIMEAQKGDDECRAIAEEFGVDPDRLARIVAASKAGADGERQEYTRVWMGLTPPRKAYPGYACVVGELFDGSWGRHRRPLVLLDEATSLAPMAAPDFEDFSQAVIALKDLYKVPWIYCDSGSHGDREQTVDTKRNYWYASLQSCHGLGYYEGEDDEVHRARFPFFESRHRTASLLDPPFVEDEDVCRQKLNALFSHDMLVVRPHCGIFDADTEYQRTGLAIAYCAIAMEYIPWVEDANQTNRMPTGYELPKREELADARRSLRQRNRKKAAVEELFSSPARRSRARRKGRNPTADLFRREKKYTPGITRLKRAMKI